MSESELRPPQDAPPIAPVVFRKGPAGQSQWPTVLGVIIVVFGVGGILGYSCGIVSVSVSPFLMKRLAERGSESDQGTAAALAAQAKYAPVLALLSFLSLLASIWLLIGGIFLLKRQRRCVGHLIAWAMTKYLIVVVVLLGSYMIRSAIIAATHSGSQGDKPPQVDVRAFEESMLLSSTFGSLLWGWALPIFVLIWFNRQSVKADTRTWS